MASILHEHTFFFPPLTFKGQRETASERCNKGDLVSTLTFTLGNSIWGVYTFELLFSTMGLCSRLLGAWQSRLYHQAALSAPWNFSEAQVILKNTFEGHIKFLLQIKFRSCSKELGHLLVWWSSTWQIIQLSFVHLHTGTHLQHSREVGHMPIMASLCAHTWPAMETWNQAPENSLPFQAGKTHSALRQRQSSAGILTQPLLCTVDLPVVSAGSWHCSPGTCFTTDFLPSSAIGCQAVTGTLSWAVLKHNSSLWLRPCAGAMCVPWNAEWLGCHLFLAKWRALEERNSIAEEKLAVDIKIKRGQPCSLVGYTALGMWQASRRPARSSGND